MKTPLIIVFLSLLTAAVMAEPSDFSINSYRQDLQQALQQTGKQPAAQAKNNDRDKDNDQADKVIDNLMAVEVIKQVSISAFHKQKQSTTELRTSLCNQCHNRWPHRESRRLRSMLNMHNNKLACETCHLSAEIQKKPNTFRYLTDKQSQIIAQIQDQPVFIPYNSDLSTSVKSQWDAAVRDMSSQPDAKAKAKQLYRAIHQPLNRSEQQLQCNNCHRQQAPYLDLGDITHDKKQVADYQNNTIADFFSRYKDDDEQINIIKLLR